LTDATVNVIKNYDYDAFSNEKNSDPNDTNLFRYCGEYFDKETGTIYLRARYYDPTIGRFITEDSYFGETNDPLSLNLYTYCANNPIMFFDPSGYLKTDGSEFTTILYRANSQYMYYSDKIKTAQKWIIITKAYDYASTVGVYTYVGFQQAPPEIKSRIFGGGIGFLNGLVSLAGGPSTNDIAVGYIESLQCKLDNLGDNGYRIQSESGRKNVISFLKELVNTKQDLIDFNNMKIAANDNLMNAYFSLALLSGRVGDKDKLNDSKRAIIDLLLKNAHLTVENDKLQDIIDDANTIIKINSD